MRRSYLDYAMSVLVGRARPLARSETRSVLSALESFGEVSSKPPYEYAVLEAPDEPPQQIEDSHCPKACLIFKLRHSARAPPEVDMY